MIRFIVNVTEKFNKCLNCGKVVCKPNCTLIQRSSNKDLVLVPSLLLVNIYNEELDRKMRNLHSNLDLPDVIYLPYPLTEVTVIYSS